MANDAEPDSPKASRPRAGSKEPIEGKTDHGTYYWLRPPPLVDCLRFPQTKTIADVQGKRWSKSDNNNEWGGGVALSAPAFVDWAPIAGRHFWATKTGPGPRSFLYTWSELGWTPLAWLRAGLAVQRTKVYQTDFDIQRGFFGAVSFRSWEVSAYLFNPEEMNTTPRSATAFPGNDPRFLSIGDAYILRFGVSASPYRLTR